MWGCCQSRGAQSDVKLLKDSLEAAALWSKAFVELKGSFPRALDGGTFCYDIEFRADKTVLLVKCTRPLREQYVGELNALECLDCVLDVRFHNTAMEGAMQILEDVMPHLPPPSSTKPLIVAGHSIGGAIAIVLALRLRLDGYTPRVITWGQPKLTSAESLARFNDLSVHRFVLESDPVPCIPPPSMVLSTNTPYSHFGTEIILSDPALHWFSSGSHAISLADTHSTKFEHQGQKLWDEIYEDVVGESETAVDFVKSHHIKKYVESLELAIEALAKRGKK